MRKLSIEEMQDLKSVDNINVEDVLASMFAAKNADVISSLTFWTACQHKSYVEPVRELDLD